MRDQRIDSSLDDRKSAPQLAGRGSKLFLWGMLVLACVALQIGASYFTIRYFLEGEVIAGFSLFLMVPFVGFIIARSYAKLRPPEKTSRPKRLRGI